MKNLLSTLLHFAVMTAKLCGPGGQDPCRLVDEQVFTGVWERGFRGIVSHNRLGAADRSQTVGTVPPSITYSVPVIEAARGDARNATRSATSLGRAGRPMGIPPSESINILRAPS